MELIKPTTSEEAKGYACTYTSRYLTKDEIEQLIREAQQELEHELPDDSVAYHEEEIRRLSDWLMSPDFIDGNHYQSIDDSLLELVEWRAMFYAFQSVNTTENPFSTHIFFHQWKVGGTYAMYSKLAKLVSRYSHDRSLRKLWWEIHCFIEQDWGSDEISYITRQLDPNSKRFSSEESKAIAFRNKVIAHIGKSIAADINDLDEDIRLISRIWSIVTSWSSFGILTPWRSDSQAFSGLEHFYNSDDIRNLKTARNEYLKNFEIWGKTNLITGEPDSRGPFATFSVSIKNAVQP